MTSKTFAIEEADRLMTSFVERTGLVSERPPVRYLWTDAFAVCNLLELAQKKGDPRYTDLARSLVDQVHHVLGRHRGDDGRTGWLSGLSGDEAEAHPTRGGLRIGKKLPERRVGEAFDADLEWERDGQYFHYLTRWMHALDRVSRATSEPRFNLWARELAETSHRAFRQGSRRMVWKMSTDLSRALVPSMGQHDPLDGFVTCSRLEATSRKLATTDGPNLKPALADFAAMIAGADFATLDPLGLGGLFLDAARVDQLVDEGALPNRDLMVNLLRSGFEGLSLYARGAELRQAATRRLAFRELGLAIGLEALGFTKDARETRSFLAALEPYLPLGSAIRSFWLEPQHQMARTWSEHRDINDVMLATSLLPEGCL